MAIILRCPSCGALWRLPEGETAQKFRCEACGTTFAADKAEAVDVPDDRLDELLKADAAKPQDAAPAAAGEASMERIAKDLAVFDAPAGSAKAPSEAPEAPEAPETPAQPDQADQEDQNHWCQWVRRLF